MLAYCFGGGNMDLLEKPVYSYIKNNHGIITFRDMEELNFSYQQLNQLVRKGKVESIERRIYHLPDTYIDDYFSLQYRFPKGIYSLETALWLHGLSLTIPFESVMTFPFGTNTRSMKEAGVKPIVARKYHEIGIIKLERQAGQFISVYDMERTLVECLRTAYHVDIQVIAPAFQAFFKKETAVIDTLEFEISSQELNGKSASGWRTAIRMTSQGRFGWILTQSYECTTPNVRCG